MPFVPAYAKDTGRKHSVPEHWFDNPVLSKNLRKTPLSEKQQRDADALLAEANSTDNPAAAADKE